MAIGHEGKAAGESVGYARSLNKLRGLKHLLIPADVKSDEDFDAAVDAICTNLQKLKLGTSDAAPEAREAKGTEPNRMHEGGQDRSKE